jgi:hypothetical protein
VSSHSWKVRPASWAEPATGGGLGIGQVGAVVDDDLDASAGAEECGRLGHVLLAGSGDLGDRCSGSLGGRVGVGGQVDQLLGHGAAGHELGGQGRDVGDVALLPVQELADELVELRGRVDGVVAIRFENGYITGAYHVGNPEKLSHVEREAAISC